MAAPKTKPDDDLLDEMVDDNDESILDLDEDISTAEAPKLLPVGTYVGEIEKVTAKESQTGSKYLAVQIRIGTDQYPATFSTDDEPDGILLFYNRLQTKDEHGNFTPRARFRLKQWCEAIDAPMGKRLNIGEWVGRTLKCKVQHGKDPDGQPNLNMQGFAAID